jgi:DNA-binding NarL/FixJ family response regulator
MAVRRRQAFDSWLRTNGSMSSARLTPAEVLPLVGRSAPRLVVLDLDLTGFDGLACVREIVALNSSVKVVVVSASADPDVMWAAFQLGACGYVLPGRDERELSTAIWQAACAAGYEA